MPENLKDTHISLKEAIANLKQTAYHLKLNTEQLRKNK